MITVHRSRGLSFVIFVNDHGPAHVHVFGAGHAKIDLMGSEGPPELVWAEGMTKTELRRAMRIATDLQADLLARWRTIHG